ncbi:TIGR03087 family PEP-CTERM/XrtA system glycosyltransferase [Burkholderiaceae bacterium UC74_6]
MADLLYLVHRLPYPPNKGDKVRSYHLLRHLAKQHRVFLGTFVDDSDDWQYVDQLKEWCTEVCAVGLKPRLARLASSRGLLSGEALSLPYYRSVELHDWVRGLSGRVKLDASVVFSSTMAQYAEALSGLPMLVDFVDVDSAKWSEYARAHRGPLSWVYGREGRKLLAYEQRVAAKARCSFFVTANETALFRQLSPGLEQRLDVVGNGVDAERFAPEAARPSPYAADELPLVFTGAMDYWPNVDAVCWFAAEVLPRLREQHPNLRFYIVGRSPTPAVVALGELPGVVVTGTVPEVQPYLQHAAAAVAPLRLARGIQNKVLEAMAMGRPVVVARNCAEVIEAEPGIELLTAVTADDYLREIGRLLADPAQADRIGAAGRACVQARYSWDARLSVIDHHLEALLQEKAAA